jgi:hypothetical protein
LLFSTNLATFRHNPQQLILANWEIAWWKLELPIALFAFDHGTGGKQPLNNNSIVMHTPLNTQFLFITLHNLWVHCKWCTHRRGYTSSTL